MANINQIQVKGTLYNLADATARAEIEAEKTRLPFGFDNVQETILITNKTLSFSETSFNFGANANYTSYEQFVAYSTSDNPLAGETWTGTSTTDFIGRRFIITWDGIEYTCGGVTGHRFWSSSASAISQDALYYLGNETIVKMSQMNFEHRDIPFVVVFSRWGTNGTDTRTLRIITNDTSATHTFSMREIVAIKTTKISTELSHGTDPYGMRQIYSGTGLFSTVANKAHDATGTYTFAEGVGTIASGQGSHAEGGFNRSSGYYTHAEGYMTIASTSTGGHYGAHAEGKGSSATSMAAHAEGVNTTASGASSHAQGQSTIAAGPVSNASGYSSEVSAAARVASANGNYVRATQSSQFIVGYANNPQSDSIFEVGNGLDANGNPANAISTSPTTRQNAFRVTQSGVAIAQTGLQIGSTGLTEAELSTIKGYSTTKQDTLIAGENITIENNVISASGGGGGGEPAAYLKMASVSGNTLTLTKKDNTTVTYTPTEQYRGTVTDVTLKMNGIALGTITSSGTFDLGTVITTHQDISGKQNISSLESDVAAKGFTKNAGTVTSVGVGTGLSISGTASVNPTINVASDCKLPTILEWNSKANSSDLTAHTGDSTIHVTASDKSTWSGKQNALTAGTNITLSGSTISAKNQVDVVNGTSPESQVEIWIDESKSYGELDPTQIVQTTGQDTLKVMSQKAVTDALATASEPAAYIKNASTSGNTLTLTKKDNSTVTYTPTEQYQGTVTSVNAGTGLNISGTSSVNPTVNVASTHKLPTTSEWSGKQDNLVFGTAYSATTNKAATIADIRAIFSLNGTELTITTTSANDEE